MLANVGKYSKFIVAILGALSSSLQIAYGGEKWVAIVVAVAAAVSVYLVPNVTPVAVEPVKDVHV